jgi:Na+/H+ antiporter NhaD/arsenite permease-like protein
MWAAGILLAIIAVAFRLLASALIPARGAKVTTAAVLTLAAVLSGLVNLDVAVLVAMPIALQTARRQGLTAHRLAVAVAATANATSFLLPTSNVTNLLLLGRHPLTTSSYLA